MKKFKNYLKRNFQLLIIVVPGAFFIAIGANHVINEKIAERKAAEKEKIERAIISSQNAF